jgi:hypothetical protein
MTVRLLIGALLAFAAMPLHVQTAEIPARIELHFQIAAGTGVS